MPLLACCGCKCHELGAKVAGRRRRRRSCWLGHGDPPSLGGSAYPGECAPSWGTAGAGLLIKLPWQASLQQRLPLHFKGFKGMDEMSCGVAATTKAHHRSWQVPDEGGFYPRAAAAAAADKMRFPANYAGPGDM